MNCPICLSKDIKNLFYNSDFELLKCNFCSVVLLYSDAEESYNEDYFSKKRKRYYQNYRYNYDQNLFPVPGYKNILKEIKKHGVSGRLLDIGCGIGVFMDLARKTGLETIGVDISSYAVQCARKYFNLDVFCGRLSQIKFSEKSFDVITLLDTIEHTDNPESLLREISRLLKDEGLLVIVVPNEEALINKLSYAIYWLSRKKIKNLVKSNHSFEHRFYFSLKSLSYLLKKCGFRIINYHYHEIDPSLMDYSFLVTLCTRIIFYFGRLLHQQHKMTIFAKKM